MNAYIDEKGLHCGWCKNNDLDLIVKNYSVGQQIYCRHCGEPLNEVCYLQDLGKLYIRDTKDFSIEIKGKIKKIVCEQFEGDLTVLFNELTESFEIKHINC